MTKPYRFPLLSRTNVQKSAAELAEEAYLQGFAAGKAEAMEQALQHGIAQGLAQADELAAAREQQLHQQLQQQYQQKFTWLAQQFRQQLQQQDSGLQQQLYELVCRLTEQVLEFELSVNPQQLIHAINHTLTLLCQHEPVNSILLSSAEAEAFTALDISSFGDISWQRDDSLPSGTIQFNGGAQLHLLDFQQRLQDVLQQFRSILMAPLPARPDEFTDAP